MLPAYTKNSIDEYIEHGIPPGDFLHAVLINDLFEAAGRADENNGASLSGICVYIYNYAPALCWGDAEKVKEWLRLHREEPATIKTIIEADREPRQNYNEIF